MCIPHRQEKGIAPIAIVGIVALLAIVAAGVYVSTQPGGLSAFFGGGLSPEETVANAITKTTEQSSATIDATVNIESADPEKPASLNVELHAEGVAFPVEENEEGEMAAPSQGSLSVEGTVDGSPIDVSLDFRSLPPTTYVMLSRLELDPSMAMPFDLTGQWIAFEKDEAGESLEMFPDAMSVAEQSACLKNEDAKNHWLETVQGGGLFASVTAGSAADLGDERAVPYTIAFDVEAMVSLHEELSAFDGCEDIEEPDDEMLAMLEDLRPVVWVGSSSDLVRGVDLTVSPEDMEGTVDVQVRLSDFNEPAEVEAPEDAQSLEEIMGEMFGGMMDTSRLMEGSTAIDPNTVLSEEDLEEMMEGFEMMAQ